jgi:phage tail sheath gpL-like
VNAVQGLVGTQDSIVIIAQKTSSGIIASKIPTTVFSDADAALDFGAGSVAHLAALYAFQSNPNINLSIVGVDDASGGTAAVYTLMPAAGTKSDTISLYIGDILISSPVAAADSAIIMGENLNTSITTSQNYYQLPFISAVNTATGVVTLTSKNKGTVGNYSSIVASLTGDAALAVAQTVQGATDPDLGSHSSSGTVLNAIAAGTYSIIINTLPTSTALGAVKSLVNFVSNGVEQRPAVQVSVATNEVDTYSNIKTLAGTILNDSRTVLGFIDYTSGTIAKPEEYKIAGALGAAIALRSGSTVNIPYDGVILNGIAAPAITDRFTRTKQEDALHNGMCILSVIPGEEVAIVRGISTYTLNSLGVPDATLTDINTIRNMDYVRYQVRGRLSNVFGGTARMTAKITGQIVSQVLDVLYKLEAISIVKNMQIYKSAVIAEVDSADPTRVNVKIPAPLVAGLHVIAGVEQLILE